MRFNASAVWYVINAFAVRVIVELVIVYVLAKLFVLSR